MATNEDAKKDSARRANNKYKKENTRTITIRFFPKDMELFDYAKSQENISQYFKNLIREDMERNNEN